LVDTKVPLNVNVSVPSLKISPVVGTLTVKVVAPAGIVICVFTIVKSLAPAVPVVVTTLMIVGTLLGLLKAITKPAVLPSNTVTLPIVTIGNGVVSTITPVALALGLLVLPEIIVPLKVNVSVPSLMLSVCVGTLTVTLVCPAGIVTVVVVVV
jgi:hypothetical protein